MIILIAGILFWGILQDIKDEKNFVPETGTQWAERTFSIVEWRGHEYIKCIGHAVSICHYPDCKFCKEENGK